MAHLQARLTPYLTELDYRKVSGPADLPFAITARAAFSGRET